MSQTYVRVGLRGEELLIHEQEYRRLVHEIRQPPNLRNTLELRMVGEQTQPLYLDMRNVDVVMLSTPEDRKLWREFHREHDDDEEEIEEREPWRT